jgi:hypothetical protein
MPAPPRLTLVACPKAFRDHHGLIQDNAVDAWMRLSRDSGAVDVVLVGDDPGVAEAAARSGALHVPNVGRNERGTPLISSIFSIGAQHARDDLLVYVNADIVLFADFLSAVRAVAAALPRFLVVGRRTDLDVTARVASVDGARSLRERAQAEGALHAPVGIDYFAFRPSTIGALPDFAVGRPHWDRWFLWHARQRGLPLVDATAAVLAVHQNHDYSHARGGVDQVWSGAEAQANFRHAGSWGHALDIRDATHVLSADHRVLKRRKRARALRTVERVAERFVLWRLPKPAQSLARDALDAVQARLG